MKSINQVVEALNLNDDDKVLNIYFDRIDQDKYKESRIIITPIAFAAVDKDKNTRVINYKDYCEKLLSVRSIIVSGKTATEIKNGYKPKMLNRLCVILDKIVFKTKEGKEMYYYNSILKEANQKLYEKMKAKLERDRSEYEEEKNNELLKNYENFFIEDDEALLCN